MDDVRAARNRKRDLEYGAAYREKNREALRLQGVGYYRSNRDKCIESVKRYEQSNKEKIAEKKRKWADKNKYVFVFAQARTLASSLNAIPAWADEFIVKEIYELSSLRTQLTGIKHHVDHVVPLRSELVCGLHCEANLQIITAFHNISKRNRYWPDMPE